MSSLINRSAVLGFSRFCNYAVLLISPIFLVRILDVEQFGQYREFVLYTGMLASILNFSVNRSLTYFLPKYPEDEAIYVSQSILAKLLISVAGLSVAWLAKPMIVQILSYDFVDALVIYTFLFLNLSFLEQYWLAKKRTDYVLYYSGARLVLRVATVISVAFLTRSISAIILSLVILEALKICFVLWLALRNRLLTFSVSRRKFRDQVNFFIPLGVAALIGQHMNKNLTSVVVTATLGPAALALYTIGNYMTPIISIGRDSIADVIFPEMAGKRTNDPALLLALWRRSTVLYCATLFPAAVCLLFASEMLVLTLFTSAYAAAIPIFQIYLLQMLTACFDMGLPLRALNKTRPFVVGNMIMLVVNVALIILFIELIGIAGAAIAYIVSIIAGSVYLGWRLMGATSWQLSELLPWNDISKIAVACLIAGAASALGLMLPLPGMAQAIALPAIFLLCYVLVIRRMHVADVDLLVQRLRSKVNKNRYDKLQ